jgi:hypothetical protein
VPHRILRQIFVGGKQDHSLATRLCHQHPVKWIAVNALQAASFNRVGLSYVERLHPHGTKHLRDEYLRFRMRGKSPEKYLLAISHTEAEEKYGDDAELERTFLAR